MNTLSYKIDFVNGWRIFCAGWYMEDCLNDAQRAGFVAAFRQAEGI